MAGPLFISNSDMKASTQKLIISTVIVCLSILIIDVLVGIIGDSAVKRMPSFSGQIAKDNYRLNRVATDIVILGSSRGNHHYVTTMLKDSINSYTCHQYTLYNAAIAGRPVSSNACAAESIMDRYTPKFIIFELTEGELYGSHSAKDLEFSSLNYRINPIVKRYVDDLGWKERVKFSSNMFRYNRKIFRIVSSYLKKGEETGYDPLYKKMTVLPSKEETEKQSGKVIDDYSLRNFTRVLQTAKEKGIPLVVVTSPRFAPTGNNAFLSSLCKEYSTPYIELYNLDLFNSHPEYFQDAGHLNDDGAHVYTEVFFEALKPYLTPLMQ